MYFIDANSKRYIADDLFCKREAPHAIYSVPHICEFDFKAVQGNFDLIKKVELILKDKSSYVPVFRY